MALGCMWRPRCGTGGLPTRSGVGPASVPDDGGDAASAEAQASIREPSRLARASGDPMPSGGARAGGRRPHRRSGVPRLVASAFDAWIAMRREAPSDRSAHSTRFSCPASSSLRQLEVGSGTTGPSRPWTTRRRLIGTATAAFGSARSTKPAPSNLRRRTPADRRGRRLKGLAALGRAEQVHRRHWPG